MLYILNALKNDNNIYKLQNIIKQETGEILTIEEFLKLEGNAYCDNLNIAFMELIKVLFNLGYKNDFKADNKKYFNFMYKAGECLQINIRHENNKILHIINFEKKFLQEFSTYEENKTLIEYAIKNNRLSNSIGHDAFNEFLKIAFKTKKQELNINACREIFRRDYPILDYDLLTQAKKYTSGYQIAKRGLYNDIYEYDITSSYPSQLVNDTPEGYPILFNDIEDIPTTYFYIIKFTAFDINIKPNKIDFLDTDKKNINTFVLTQHLFNLFKKNYTYTILKIKSIIAFKTRKGRFNEFIKKNIIDGKINAKNEHIAKYNKAIANSLTGYFGKNTQKEIIKVEKNGNKYNFITDTIQTDPVYLPIYLYVTGKAKAEFINTLQNTAKNGIIYANTDGFLTNIKLDINALNIGRFGVLGTFKEKHLFKKIYIDCINGYSAEDYAGNIYNSISGLTTLNKLSVEQYEHRTFDYYCNEIDDNGNIIQNACKR